MDILEKLDLITENKDIPKGLIGWVADYIEARMEGNSKLAKNIKKNLDKEIKELGLNSKEVFMYFGDPDDPKQKDSVMKKINKFRG